VGGAGFLSSVSLAFTPALAVIHKHKATANKAVRPAAIGLICVFLKIIPNGVSNWFDDSLRGRVVGPQILSADVLYEV
jgi:hypothetical protein